MSWSRGNTEYSIYRVQHTPSTAYTEYSIQWVLHHSKIDCLPLPASLSALSGPCCTQFSTLPQLWVNQWIESQLPLHMPPVLLPPKQLPPDPLPPYVSPYMLNYVFQVHHWVHSISASKCISELNRSHPPSSSLSSLNIGLQMRLQTRLIPPSKCISQFTHSLDLQVHRQTCSITACKCISEFTPISVSKCISNLARSRPPSASRNMLDHEL